MISDRSGTRGDDLGSEESRTTIYRAVLRIAARRWQMRIERTVPYRLFRALFGRPEDVAKRIVGLVRLGRDLSRYRRAAGIRFQARLGDLSPQLGDWNDQAGVARGHYFHQDLWVAREIHRRMPKDHWDIGSRVDGFIAHLLVFRDVIFVDVREMSGFARGLTAVVGSVTALDVPDGSVCSLSCLHVLEHVGLGRYGDTIDPLGHESGARELSRILAPGGTLYLSVPVGRERLEFNAHRVFSPQAVPALFPGFRLETFVAVNDDGALVEDCVPADFADADYACGIYLFRKSEPLEGANCTSSASESPFQKPTEHQVTGPRQRERRDCRGTSRPIGR